MKQFVDFYKNLDTLNIIMFWGIIIIIILILILLVILICKRRKTKIVVTNENIDNNHYDIPIQSKEILTANKIENNQQSEVVSPESNIFFEEEKKDIEEEKNNEIKEEKNFIAEEHVIEYNQNIVKDSDKQNINKTETEKNIDPPIPTGPYQRNVLKDLPSLTSPIGIVTRKRDDSLELEKAKELKSILNDNQSESKLNQRPKEIIEPKPEKYNYLEKVKDSLSKAAESDEITRTEYEKQQEDDAIISYEELMQKKDQIKMIDEEEAVISIDELLRKKTNDDKLYQLTEEEENDKFINELKSFRKDL